MNHLKALGMKYVLVSVAMLMILSVFNYRISVILLLSAVVTALAYVIGDLFILPRFGNVIATVVDFALAFVALWLFNSYYIDHASHIILVSFFTALLISAGELFFHAYLNVSFYGKDSPITSDIVRGNYQRYATEFAEENNITNLEKKSTEE